MTNFINHIIHCIQETEGIELSSKSKQDIRLTIQAACQSATNGMKENMFMWRDLYYDRKKDLELCQAQKALVESKLRSGEHERERNSQYSS